MNSAIKIDDTVLIACENQSEKVKWERMDLDYGLE